MMPSLSIASLPTTPTVPTPPVAAVAHAPALGRIPTQVVPASIQSPHIADNKQNKQPTPSRAEAATPAETPFVGTQSPNALGKSSIVLETPFSTAFLAQIFGQMLGKKDGIASDLVDYDFIAQFSAVKYKPSGAFQSREASSTHAEICLFSHASAAYDATQAPPPAPTTQSVSLIS